LRARLQIPAVATGALASVLLAAPGAGAAVTIGQTAPANTQLCGTGNSAQSAEAGPPSYVVPSSGVITAWQHKPHLDGGDGRLLVWDGPPVSPLTLVGRSAVEVFMPGQVRSFSTRVSVSAGDVLGLRVHSMNAGCTFITGAGDTAIATGGAPDIVPGESMTTTSTLPNQRVNVSATLEPDADLDGFGDETQDNCAGAPNVTQADFDANGSGDACDIPRCAGIVATIAGSAGDDKLRGTRKRDVIAAGAGNDRVKGRKGKDLICGGDGADRLSGGASRDRLIGGPGLDKFPGRKGKDRRRQ
jgi:RTX calcium-binding nonapeptide repeat (4 copies)